MDRIQRALIIAALSWAGAASAQFPAPPAVVLPATTAPAIVVTDLALAYTPEEGNTRLEVEAWDEGGATLGDTLGARVDYFTVVPATINLGVGGQLALANLRIDALGLNGNPVPRAPLKLTLEAPEGLIDVDLALSERRLLAMRVGIGRLWIESLLPRGTGTGEHYRLPVVILVR